MKAAELRAFLCPGAVKNIANKLCKGILYPQI